MAETKERKGQSSTSITSRNENDHRSVFVSNNSSHDAADTVSHLIQSNNQRIRSSNDSFQNTPAISSGISTGFETIISRALESSLQPYINRLQQFEENLSRIDHTVRELQGAVTVLQSVTKHEAPGAKYEGFLSQGSSMQSITPNSCASHSPSRYNLSTCNSGMNAQTSCLLLPPDSSRNYLLNHRDSGMDQSQEYDQIRSRTFSI